MIINISKFDNESYIFASKYLTKCKGKIWDPSFAGFANEMYRKEHDNEDFDIDIDVFQWDHCMIAERYIDKHESRRTPTNTYLMNRELGERNPNRRNMNTYLMSRELGERNPKRRNMNSEGGSKTKRRGPRRARRTHRRRA